MCVQKRITGLVQVTSTDPTHSNTATSPVTFVTFEPELAIAWLLNPKNRLFVLAVIVVCFMSGVVSDVFSMTLDPYCTIPFFVFLIGESTKTLFFGLPYPFGKYYYQKDDTDDEPSCMRDYASFCSSFVLISVFASVGVIGSVSDRLVPVVVLGVIGFALMYLSAVTYMFIYHTDHSSIIEEGLIEPQNENL